MTSAHASNPLRPRLRKSMTALAVAMAFAAAAPASHAGHMTRERTVSIRYDRAALVDPESARDLYSRIRTAARFACGDADFRDLVTMRQVNQCRADAVARAVERIGSATLGALHRRHAHSRCLGRLTPVANGRLASGSRATRFAARRPRLPAVSRDARPSRNPPGPSTGPFPV